MEQLEATDDTELIRDRRPLGTSPASPSPPAAPPSPPAATPSPPTLASPAAASLLVLASLVCMPVA